ncbi:MAG: UDP-glucose 4-epimerase GalE [Betaproteobacteria bacterium]|jgi:UDP-glucose 4-epimerase|nr:UDP-glucose 4-epimerase GalE [Betaproteobacteria bacterium]NBU49091.1 UDP-glucose 4-epimerase GalE [Betaproteobacteria bacterium]NBX96049.1 UDP-glucose 4-epimerase GalE [Betaproteobacteria bacterium]
MTSVLLTGATGYIGSHTWVALHEAGFRVVGLDNFSNSSPQVLRRLERLTGSALSFEQADVTDQAAVASALTRHRIAAVVHFAALKAVGESTAQPLDYYRNNIGGLVSLCRAMQSTACQHLVFSSSATVYGKPDSLPIREDAPVQATNPYGQTKRMGEQILHDLGRADPAWRTGILRYFNPVGAHESGLIGEDPRGVPNNLMPYVAQVAVGRREKLHVFGNDYQTSDGTGVRDYIHVMDLAQGHVAALQAMLAGGDSFTVNLGTGQGYSVLELVRAYEVASGRPIPYEVVARRPGDIDACYADPTRAHDLLGWRAQHGLQRMCQDSWHWQRLNPQGFESSEPA